MGQLGGGNNLYQKIDQAIRNAKVVIACITPKFVVSHFCNREMALADLLRKPIVPIMLHATPWPPPSMGLIFSQLVYVDYFGVGGHGGCGINADLEQRNNEIIAMVSRHINPSSYFLMKIDRNMDNNEQEQNKNKPKHMVDSMKNTQTLVRQMPPSSTLPQRDVSNNVRMQNDANNNTINRLITTGDNRIGSVNLITSHSRNEGLQQVQQTNISKCAVCSLL